MTARRSKSRKEMSARKATNAPRAIAFGDGRGVSGAAGGLLLLLLLPLVLLRRRGGMTNEPRTQASAMGVLSKQGSLWHPHALCLWPCVRSEVYVRKRCLLSVGRKRWKEEVRRRETQGRARSKQARGPEHPPYHPPYTNHTTQPTAQPTAQAGAKTATTDATGLS